MSEVFDLQPAIKQVLSSDHLLKTPGFDPGTSRFDAGENDGLYEGTVPAGATLASRCSLLVEGSLDGGAGKVCRIEVDGDAIITGDVHYAAIKCRNLRIGGVLHDSQVNAVEQVTVGADLARSRLILNDYQARQSRIEELRNALLRLQDQRANFERRINQDEKRLDRACKATHIPIKFVLNRVIYHEPNRVRVDLASFYTSLGEQPEAKMEMALNEFFAKGMIGHLAKANRQYIIDNPAREKVFLQLLGYLRELVNGVFQRDRVMVAIHRTQGEIDRAIEALHQPGFSASVRGGILPETRVEFMLPLVLRKNDEIKFVHQYALLNVQSGLQPGSLRLEHHHGQGESTAEDADAAELQGIVLYVSDGQIVRKRISGV